MSIAPDLANKIATQINQSVQSNLRGLIIWRSIRDERERNAPVVLMVREQGLPSFAEFIIQCSEDEEDRRKLYVDVHAVMEMDVSATIGSKTEDIERILEKYKTAKPTVITKQSYRREQNGGPGISVHRTLEVKLTVFRGQFESTEAEGWNVEGIGGLAAKALNSLAEIRKDAKLTSESASFYNVKTTNNDR